VQFFWGIPATGRSGGQAIRSYACRRYAHWPVSTSVLNATRRNLFCFSVHSKKSPARGGGSFFYLAFRLPVYTIPICGPQATRLRQRLGCSRMGSKYIFVILNAVKDLITLTGKRATCRIYKILHFAFRMTNEKPDYLNTSAQ
jgi:hypothetical protein